eukprot:11713_4
MAGFGRTGLKARTAAVSPHEDAGRLLRRALPQAPLQPRRRVRWRRWLRSPWLLCFRHPRPARGAQARPFRHACRPRFPRSGEVHPPLLPTSPPSMPTTTLFSRVVAPRSSSGSPSLRSSALSLFSRPSRASVSLETSRSTPSALPRTRRPSRSTALLRSSTPALPSPSAASSTST